MAVEEAVEAGAEEGVATIIKSMSECVSAIGKLRKSHLIAISIISVQ